MHGSVDKHKTIEHLQKKLLEWQGFKETEKASASLGLGRLEHAFPGHIFPLGHVHEFITSNREEEAASSGFIGGLLSALMRQGGLSLWIGRSQQLFAPSIKMFGVEPDRVIFVCMSKEKDILWALEEALKCDGLRAVVAEVEDLDFVQSRRLQLAVEKSKVTGLIVRTATKVQMTTACAARWQIRSLPSKIVDGLPGVGFPYWEVSLLKVRNGNPSRWQVAWQNHAFQAQPMQRAQDGRPVAAQLKVG